MPYQLKRLGSRSRVAVIGAGGGIGSAFVRALTAQEEVEIVYALSRAGEGKVDGKTVSIPIDVTDEASIAAAAAACDGPLDVVIVATGMLSDNESLPEKALRDLDMAAMQRCFTVNAFGPALVAKHFLPLLPRGRAGAFAALSARVGSISDNALGGWYSYRASKAALNMALKNAAIETARRNKHAVIIGLHPGTVDTPLSQPFQGNVKHEIFAADVAAEHLLKVIDKATPVDSGRCYAWDGQEVAP